MATVPPKSTLADVVARLDAIETQVRLARLALLQLDQTTTIKLTPEIEALLQVVPKLPWSLPC
jgi:hypothetical protein